MTRERANGSQTKVNANGRQKVTGAGRGQGGGRPLLPIDPKVVEGMAFVGATNEEIADFLETTPETIERRFLPLLRKSRADLRVRLRRQQLRVASEGNPTMLIWLGKQMLNQHDKTEVEHSTPPGEKKQIAIIFGERIEF